MKKFCLLALAVLLVIAAPLATWLYEPVPVPVYAQNGISITLSGSIDFGTVTPPVTEQGATDQSEGTPAVGVWVESETAVSVNISIKGATTGSIALGNWKYSENFTGTKVPLSSTYEVVYSGVSSNNTYDFYHWVDVPAGTPAGLQECTVYYQAVELP